MSSPGTLSLLQGVEYHFHLLVTLAFHIKGTNGTLFGSGWD